MTLTVRQASVTGATTAARALTYAEMDANWKHLVDADANAAAALAADSGSSLVGFIQSGTGAVSRTVQAVLRDSARLTDFLPAGYVLDGSVDYTTYIQAAHDALAAVTTTGKKTLIIPAGIYKFTATLNWSPLVAIMTDGEVVFTTALASGKGMYVSTQWGNWDTPTHQTNYNTDIFIQGKFILENTNGSTTATGMFFGYDSASTTYSAESLAMQGLFLRGWSKATQYGTNAYLLTFIACQFRNNTDALYLDSSPYSIRLERMTYIGCTFANNTNVVNGSGDPGGDFTLQSCSYDYNTTLIKDWGAITTTFCIGGGSHIEFSTSTTQIVAHGASVFLSGYNVYYSGAGSGPNPLIASVGAQGFVRSRGFTANTPSSATLFDVSSSTGKLELDDDYKQLGGAATSYFTNTGTGSIAQHFTWTSANNYTLGANNTLKLRAIETAAFASFTKSCDIGASVDIFKVGPVVSWASGRLTVQSTSSGIATAKIIDFITMGNGTAGGVTISKSSDYAGGASTFTVTETANSPSGYNKVTLNNTSGVACTFTCSLQIDFVSSGGEVVLL